MDFTNRDELDDYIRRGRDTIWTLRDVPDQEICHTCIFTRGFFVTDSGVFQATVQRPILFWPTCDLTGRPQLAESPLIDTAKTPFLIAYLPGWRDWVDYSLHTTVESFVCVVSIALALVLVLFCAVVCKERPWRPVLIFISVLFSAIHMALVMDNVLNSLSKQYKYLGGYTITWLFTDILSTKIKATNFVSSVLLMTAQLQLVAVRLVDRKTERAIVWFAGGIIVIAASILLGLVWFYRPDDAILFAVHYFLSMGLETMYLLMVLLYAISHQQSAFHWDVISYTALAIPAAALPVALYMADIFGWWTARTVDHVCSFSAVAALVLVDVWASQLDRHRTKQAHGNIMGRRLYNPDKELVFTEANEELLDRSTEDSAEGPVRTASAPVNTHTWLPASPFDRPATT